MKAKEILDPYYSVFEDSETHVEYRHITYADALKVVKEAYRLGANAALDKADSETWVHSNSILLLKDTILLED